MTLPPSTRLVAGAAAAGAAALAWGTLVEPRLFTLRRYALPVLRPGSLPVRVLQLSDIHMVPGQRTKADWIRGLAALEPDLVVNTGDNLSHLQAVPHALEALKPLLERPGVFVMGSNDYYAPTPKNPGRYLTKDYAKVVAERVALPTEELRSGMTDAGWVDLDNARTSLHLGGQRIDLVGVDDPHIERDDYASVSAPAAADATTVGVAHGLHAEDLEDGGPHQGAGETRLRLRGCQRPVVRHQTGCLRVVDRVCREHPFLQRRHVGPLSEHPPPLLRRRQAVGEAGVEPRRALGVEEAVEIRARQRPRGAHEPVAHGAVGIGDVDGTPGEGDGGRHGFS